MAALLGSLALSIAVLSLRLILQSRALTAMDENKRINLAKQIEKVSLWVATPLGLVMLILGIAINSLENSFLPVGVTLVGTSITMLVQSKSLNLPNSKMSSFSKFLKILAFVCAGAAVLGLVVVIYLLVKSF